uniref:Uncharacterized protein n=1 Tax=Glossina austeni TaxID=7395 RepID=A0A1A9V3W8_GLOAU
MEAWKQIMWNIKERSRRSVSIAVAAAAVQLLGAAFKNTLCLTVAYIGFLFTQQTIQNDCQDRHYILRLQSTYLSTKAFAQA